MKTEKQVEALLIGRAERFKEYVRAKKYAKAKWCYDTALTLAVELNVDDDLKKRLFGNRPYVDKEEDIVDGLFSEQSVMKTMEECWRDEKERLEEEQKRRAYQYGRIYKFRQKK